MQVQQFERVNEILTKGTKVEGMAHWKARRARFIKGIAENCDSVERVAGAKYETYRFTVFFTSPIDLTEMDFWMYAGGLPEWVKGMNDGETRFRYRCPE